MRKIIRFLMCVFSIIAIGLSVIYHENNLKPIIANAEDCYSAETDLINPPTVVATLESNTQLQNIIVDEEKPSNIILSMKENKVVDKNGAVIGIFEEIVAALAKQNILSIARVEEENTADTLITIIQENRLLDLAVASSNSALIKKVKSAEGCQHIRGIWYCSATQELSELVKESNMAYVLVVVLPQSMATTKNVLYIQARFKTVWVALDDESDINVRHCINTGTYGLIVKDYGKVYDIYKTYPASRTRSPFNVAHRGVSNLRPENSLSGVEMAIEKGATHIELDAYISTDNHIIMMHDASIDRMTNGSGEIEKMTLEELRQYKLGYLDGFKVVEEDIPTIDDVMLAMKDTDVILVLEIKSNESRLINVLREKIEKYNFWSQMVVISFSQAQLKNMKEMIPEIPTSYLCSVDKSAFPSFFTMMGNLNSSLDLERANETKEFNQFLCDRGIACWYWTYPDFYQTYYLNSFGVTGMVNDKAEQAENCIFYINGIHKSNKPTIGEIVELEAVLYNGETTLLHGKIEYIEETKTSYEIICSYTEEGRTRFTEKYAINKKLMGCASTSSYASVVLLFLGCALMERKKLMYKGEKN